MSLSIIRNTIPSTSYSHLVVRHFGHADQRVVGTVKDTLFWPNDVDLSEDDLLEVGRLMRWLKTCEERHLVNKYHELMHRPVNVPLH